MLILCPILFNGYYVIKNGIKRSDITLYKIKNDQVKIMDLQHLYGLFFVLLYQCFGWLLSKISQMIFILAWNLAIFAVIIFFGFNVAFNLFSAVFTVYLVLCIAKNKVKKDDFTFDRAKHGEFKYGGVALVWMVFILISWITYDVIEFLK